jgi:hypothetical protein
MQAGGWAIVFRIALGVGVIVLSIGAGAAVYWHFYLSPISLTLAVAPAGSDISQFFTAFAENAKLTGSRVRLSIVAYENIAETTAALDAGDVDLAYARPDCRMPSSGLALAVLQQNIAVLVTCPPRPAARGSATALSKSRAPAPISGLKDLRARRVAVLGQGPSNIALLERLLGFHGIARDDAAIFRFGSSDDLPAVGRSDAPDVLFLAGPRGELRMAGGVSAFQCPGSLPATVLPITEGGMLAARNKIFSMVDLAIGELAVNPPRPEEAISTLGFPSLLVAHQNLSESTIEEFMKQLFKSRQVLMSYHPAATRIEPLPTDRGTTFSLHPGATLYYDAEEESFFDRYEVLIYIILFGFSGIVSGLLWFTRHLFPQRPPLAMREERALETLITRARAATTTAELDAIEVELDELLATLSGYMVKGSLDVGLTPAYELMARRANGAIELRRRTLSEISIPAEH